MTRASRPSDSAAAPAATPTTALPKFLPCPSCPKASDCEFEGQCDDKRKHGGRPSLYSAALAESLLVWIAGGKSQRSWCEIDGNPGMSTVLTWARSVPGFRDSLTHAREDWTHSLLDEAQDIADDGLNDTYKDQDGNERVNTDVVQRSKLRVETRMKLAAMVNPKRYGAKLDLTSDGKAINMQSDDELAARMAALQVKAREMALLQDAVSGGEDAL